MKIRNNSVRTADWSLESLSALQEELEDDTNTLTADIWACGSVVLDGLRQAVRKSLDDSTKVVGCSLLDGMITFAHESLSYQSPNRRWRRLYTDSCLFRTLADFATEPLPVENDLFESIARLDRAIIIAGAPGEGRHGLILDTIKRIQSQHLPSHTSPILPPSSPPSSRQHVQLETSSNPVLHLDAPPSLSSFRAHSSRQPFILRGYASEWPAVQNSSWQSLDYLRSVAGPGRIVPVEVGKDYRTDDWTQSLMPWDEFLDLLDSPQGETLYLAQHNIFTQFPTLKNDIISPDYVYACLDPPVDFPSYEPPGNEEHLVINAWLGPKGTMTPAHTDPYFNFYVQVVGHKTVWLAPPHVSPFMNSYTPSSPAASDRSYNPATTSTTSQLGNTSQVNVFPPPSVPQAEQRDAHPDFWDKVVPNAISATLEPGDLLFFPPGWWHAMRSEDRSFSVSMWF